MAAAYPIVLDVTERLTVIVGGGSVAARKATALTECGARCVRAVAPEFHGTFPAQVQQVRETYRPDHLDGAFLVFAATGSPEINQAVVRDAHARGALVNRADADDEHAGDFIVPARLQRGPVLASVSAGSAALAVLVRNGLAGRWDEGWTRMAVAMQTLRPRILGNIRLNPDARRAALRDLATDEAIDVLTRDGAPGLERWLAARHPLAAGDNLP